MEIRAATLAESATVAELVLALLEELSAPEPSGYDAAGLTELALTLMRGGEVHGLLAWEGREPVGVLVLNGCASLYAGRFGEITELYIKPAWRSAGVGQSLLEAAREFARGRAWTRLEVGTPELPAWARTAAFYRRNGFIETGARMKLPL